MKNHILNQDLTIANTTNRIEPSDCVRQWLEKGDLPLNFIYWNSEKESRSKVAKFYFFYLYSLIVSIFISKIKVKHFRRLHFILFPLSTYHVVNPKLG